jgi:hypothetical protein
MATAVAAPPSRDSGKLYPHAHWYFIAAIATTWVGFSRSYFMRLGSVTIYHHLHGAIAGLWIATLIVQPWLYQRGQLKLHRKIGYLAAYLLAPLMVIGGSVMLHLMLAHPEGYPPGAAYTLGFLDFLSLLEFPAFVILAIYFARDLALHARWIAGTVLLLLPPALTRAMFFLPFVRSFGMALNLCYPVIEVILLLLIADDRRYGRIRAPYPIMLALTVLAHVTLNFAAGWGWWHQLADWYGGV